jgi:hypothetical protein
VTIDEAIEKNTHLLKAYPEFFDDDETKAIQLGIEALQRERERRFNPRIQPRVLLPSETD